MRRITTASRALNPNINAQILSHLWHDKQLVSLLSTVAAIGNHWSQRALARVEEGHAASLTLLILLLAAAARALVACRGSPMVEAHDYDRRNSKARRRRSASRLVCAAGVTDLPPPFPLGWFAMAEAKVCTDTRIVIQPDFTVADSLCLTYTIDANERRCLDCRRPVHALGFPHLL